MSQEHEIGHNSRAETMPAIRNWWLQDVIRATGLWDWQTSVHWQWKDHLWAWPRPEMVKNQWPFLSGGRWHRSPWFVWSHEKHEHETQQLEVVLKGSIDVGKRSQTELRPTSRLSWPDAAGGRSPYWTSSCILRWDMESMITWHPQPPKHGAIHRNCMRSCEIWG